MVSLADSAFGASDVIGAVNNLALQIGKIDRVKIDDANFADAGRGQVHGDGGAEAARADADDAGGANFFLPGQSDFRQNQMARIAANFVIVQLHKNQWFKG